MQRSGPFGMKGAEGSVYFSTVGSKETLDLEINWTIFDFHFYATFLTNFLFFLYRLRRHFWRVERGLFRVSFKASRCNVKPEDERERRNGTIPLV